MVSILLLSECTTYTDFSIGGNNANLAKYHSFAWLPPADTTTSAGYNDLADHKIKDEATAKLVESGFSMTSRRPDLLVRYSTMFKDKTHTYYNEPTYTYFGSGYYPSRLTIVVCGTAITTLHSLTQYTQAMK